MWPMYRFPSRATWKDSIDSRVFLAIAHYLTYQWSVVVAEVPYPRVGGVESSTNFNTAARGKEK